MAEIEGVPLEDLIDSIKRDDELLGAAWEMYRGQVERADEAEHRLELAVAEIQALRSAFILHRTETHEVAPSRCKTCVRSDEVIALAAKRLKELEGA
jgi:hypothetical protein